VRYKELSPHKQSPITDQTKHLHKPTGPLPARTKASRTTQPAPKKQSCLSETSALRCDWRIRLLVPACETTLACGSWSRLPTARSFPFTPAATTGQPGMAIGRRGEGCTTRHRVGNSTSMIMTRSPRVASSILSLSFTVDIVRCYVLSVLLLSAPSFFSSVTLHSLHVRILEDEVF
jgi:hypothetical protein